MNHYLRARGWQLDSLGGLPMPSSRRAPLWIEFSRRVPNLYRFRSYIVYIVRLFMIVLSSSPTMQDSRICH